MSPNGLESPTELIDAPQIHCSCTPVSVVEKKKKKSPIPATKQSLQSNQTDRQVACAQQQHAKY